MTAMFSLALAQQVVFQNALKAHQNFVKGHAAISVGNGKDTVRYDLSFARPDKTKLRIIEPARPGRPGSDRLYLLSGSRLLAYDSEQHQYLERNNLSGSLASRLKTALGDLDESIAILIDGVSATQFFARMGGLRGWATRDGHLKYSASIDKRPTRFDLVFTASNLLSRAIFDAAGHHLSWKFDYSAGPALFEFKVPSGARRVTSFTVAGPPPQYGDAAAKNAVQMAVKAYRNVRSLSFTIIRETESSQVSVAGNAFSQEDAQSGIYFSGQTLTLLDRAHNVAYRGQASLDSIDRFAAKLKIRVDPLVMQLVRGQNPIQKILAPDLKLRSAGQIVLQGVGCRIVEATAKGVKISLVIRQKDGLLAQTAMTAYDAKNRETTRSERSYEYREAKAPTLGLGKARVKRLLDLPGPN